LSIWSDAAISIWAQNMNGFLNFLREKIKGYPIGLLFRLEFESLLFGIGSAIPTTVGVFFRAFLCKVFFKKCGGLCWVQPRVTIIHTERLKVGRNFGVNSESYINAIGEIEIGNFVLIGNGVTISSGMHPVDGHFPEVFARQSIPKKITIEDDVWIGAGAVIMPGVTLARGTVIGANSIVNKNTEPYSVNVGAPARLLRYR